ncbi:hypothetical protein EYF80_030068 [Liparis tanakae]|uniref:Uncharacterized protein n=1 Tax=Liparis tanakae TaxID=230148 RepID=A0A4Z2H1D9_9TELE|nr:hypothetical protein EYF80_030068 [Liparis tanakae]
MSTQPSMVMHWNTVSTANRMLSKLVMPKLGPVQYSLHWVPLGQVLAGGSRPQGQDYPVPECMEGAREFCLKDLLAHSSADRGIRRKNEYKCAEYTTDAARAQSSTRDSAAMPAPKPDCTADFPLVSLQWNESGCQKDSASAERVGTSQSQRGSSWNTPLKLRRDVNTVHVEGVATHQTPLRRSDSHGEERQEVLALLALT